MKATAIDRTAVVVTLGVTELELVLADQVEFMSTALVDNLGGVLTAGEGTDKAGLLAVRTL